MRNWEVTFRGLSSRGCHALWGKDRGLGVVSLGRVTQGGNRVRLLKYVADKCKPASSLRGTSRGKVFISTTLQDRGALLEKLQIESALWQI